VSLWLTGLKELSTSCRPSSAWPRTWAARSASCNALVFDEIGYGLARADRSLFGGRRGTREAAIAEAQELAKSLSVPFDASGATGRALASSGRGEKRGRPAAGRGR